MMRRAFAAGSVFFACALVACDRSSAGHVASAIRDGQLTTGYPAVVALGAARGSCDQAFEPTCTATLIAPRVVLTAAHCIPDARGGTYEVFAGSDVAGAGQFLRGSARIHPAYNRDLDAHAFDIAVVILDEESTIAPLPMRVAAIDATTLGASVTMVGFGLTTATGIPDGRKRIGTGTLSQIDPGSLRVLPAPSVTCPGDSGGPVLLADGSGGEAVAGVAAWGDAACTSYSVATRVDSTLSDFLASILDEASQPPALRPLLQPGDQLCAMECAVSDDCPKGTLCLQEGDRYFCAIPGFGRGALGEVCKDDATCRTCVRIAASADAEACRCFLPCSAASTSGGCEAAVQQPRRSPFAWAFLSFVLLWISWRMIRRGTACH